MNLNGRSLGLVESLLALAEERKVAAHPIERGGRFVDCGIEARGGLRAGLELARVCLADLAEVTLVPGDVAGRSCPLVQVVTDHPVEACLASQYAGWQIQEGKFFAMGSGPMRAACGPRGDLREDRPPRDRPGRGGRPGRPEDADARRRGQDRLELRRPPSAVTLLVAPTASLAGGIQVVARSVETALHKLAELDFDLSRVVAGHGTAPLPPVAPDDLAAIGRTNDAILYGARVILFVTGDDASLKEIGPQVPSTSSRDHGEPFAAIFARYNNDFYAVDPHLFSPAEVVFQNVETGRVHAFGQMAPDVLVRSFFS